MDHNSVYRQMNSQPISLEIKLEDHAILRHAVIFGGVEIVLEEPIHSRLTFIWCQ